MAETTLSESTELSAASGSHADVASVTTPADVDPAPTESQEQVGEPVSDTKPTSTRPTVRTGGYVTAAELAGYLGTVTDLERGEDGRLKAVEREVTEADILSFRQSGSEIIVVTADGRRHALCAGDLT